MSSGDSPFETYRSEMREALALFGSVYSSLTGATIAPRGNSETVRQHKLRLADEAMTLEISLCQKQLAGIAGLIVDGEHEQAKKLWLSYVDNHHVMDGWNAWRSWVDDRFDGREDWAQERIGDFTLIHGHEIDTQAMFCVTSQMCTEVWVAIYHAEKQDLA